ncbi:MAG: glycosyltransferase family 4 protein [Candidatus Peregrinibacteria bacterium]|nr:glycosyltransferase family 4 protein [Candidatus Peregrinibacteria bacterium]MCB9808002.1 glycosyltransferase family 4 protein [Candidatus Peribacteria bacterium]
MRIAIFSATIDRTNGYGNIAYELCKTLRHEGIEFVLFLPRNEKRFTKDLPFATRCVLPKNVFRLYQREGWKYFKSVDVSAFDIVHSLFAFPFCIPAYRSAKKYGKPFLMGAQGTYGVRPLTQFPENIFLKQCYRSAKAVTVPSVFTKEQIQKYAGREYPITVIHNGVDFNRFQRSVPDIKNQFEGKKMLMTVGGLKERKGQDLVLRALQIVLRERDDVEYVLVGAGNWESGLRKLAAELGIADHVVFAGSKQGDELVSYFNACDIYVHTPKVVDLNFEGFGIVYLEASACGKPIVAADAGGIRDAVLDGKTGLIAPDGDIDAIAAHILTLLGDSAMVRKMGEAGRQYASKNDWNSVAQGFIKLYSQAHG